MPTASEPLGQSVAIHPDFLPGEPKARKFNGQVRVPVSQKAGSRVGGGPNSPNILFDNMRLSGYKKFMKKEAQLFKSLADETRLRILWLLMAKEELCVCDILGVLGITQSKASRHLRYLYHLGWVTDRREGVWMNYRLSVTPGSPEDKQLRLLADILPSRPEAQALRTRLEEWLEAKRQSQDGAAACQCS